MTRDQHRYPMNATFSTGKSSSWATCIRWLCLLLATGAVLLVTPPSPGFAEGRIQQGVVVGSPTMDPGLEALPAAAESFQIDPTHPAWMTYYGTELGRQQVAPRPAPASLTPTGPEAPIGFWATLTVQAGARPITALAAALDGRFFVGVNGDGLRIYAANAEGVYGWTAVHAAAGGLASENVTALAVLNNELWVGTSSAGISILNLTNQIWRTVNTANSALPGNAIQSLSTISPPSGGDYLWVGTNAGAARWTPGRPGSWSVINTSDGLPNNTVRDVAVQYFGDTPHTWFSTNGLGLARMINNSISIINGPSTCPFDRATQLEVDRSGFLWFGAEQEVPAASLSADAATAAAGTDDRQTPDAPTVNVPIGVCRFLPFIGWRLYTVSSPGLPGAVLTGLSADAAGRMWMSFNGGIAVHDQDTWAIYKSPITPLANNDVRNVLAVNETVWFGHGGGSLLTQHSPNWNAFTATTMKGSGAPTALLVEDATTWVGLGFGLASRDANTWTYRTIPGNNAVITSLARDGAGKLWIGTAGNGAWEWDGGAGSSAFTSHVFAPNGEGLPSSDVRDIAIDTAGRAWLATAGGLAMRANGYWVSLTQANSDLPSDDLTTLTVDASGRIWAGTTAHGIGIFTPEASGDQAWTMVTTANGLPANAIHSLTTAPDGAVWVGASAGAAVWNPSTSAWTVYTTVHGLPDNNVLSLAADPAGRIWVGTSKGLAHFQAGNWSDPPAFHVTGSALAADRTVALAADGDFLWAAAGNKVAVRGVLSKPVGKPAPVVAAFAPSQGAPFTQVTITGQNFDSRGPEFNKVYFALLNAYYAAQVLSATSTQLVVEVPATAINGRIWVRANGLNGQSATDFVVAPGISGFSGSCRGVGGKLVINGAGFTAQGPYTAYVKIGNGAWRLADAWDASSLTTFIRPTDTSGKVMVRLGQNGPTATSAQNLQVATIQFASAAIQQAVEGAQLIWGKRTLIQLGLKSSGSGGACTIYVDSGKVEWKKVGGTRVAASYVMKSDLVSIFETPFSPLSMNLVPSFVAEFESGRSGFSSFFPLNQFDGVRITLRRHGIEVFTVDLPKSAFNYIDAGVQRRYTFMAVVPSSGGDPDFWGTAVKNMEHFARGYPQQDVAFTHGSNAWMGWVSAYLVRDDVDLRLDSDTDIPDDDEDDGSDIRSDVDDYLDPSGNVSGIALIDDKATDPDNTAAGRWGTWYDTGIVVNTPGVGGKTMMHEAMHHEGLVDSDQDNYDDDNEAHSRYDEGQWWDGSAADGGISNCDLTRSYQRSLLDQTGGWKRTVLLTRGEPALVFALGCGQWSRAKSVIAYTPRRNNVNTFLEPLDYQYLLEELEIVDSQAAAQQDAVSLALTEPMLAEQSLPEPNLSATFRFHFHINQAGVVTPTLSYLETPPGAISAPDPTGAYHLQVRSASGLLLHDHPFQIGFGGGHGHGGKNDEHSNPDLPDPEMHILLRVPWPDGAAKAELYRQTNATSTLLWSRQMSANAPTVSFTSPLSGSYAAQVPVAWSAGDQDGDTLQFSLEYSADNGQTWNLIDPTLTGNSLNWQPGFVPPSDAGRLRLRASDGFHTATALSATFKLGARPPVAFITDPTEGVTYREGETIALLGGSQTASGLDAGAFLWRYDGVQIGAAREMTFTLPEVGLHTLTLQVTANAQTATDAVTILVIADTDGDGLPNAWEQEHRLNPLSAGDAGSDADSDGLSNRDEYDLGTDPRQVDTDGDGASDGSEVAAATDPLDPHDKPASAATLNTGAYHLHFVTSVGSSPAPKSFWITNGGPGVLNWTAVSDSPWLQISPASGAAPTEAAITINPAGLAPGEYTGHVTISAPAAAGSPDEIHVTLVVTLPGPFRSFLPVIERR